MGSLQRHYKYDQGTQAKNIQGQGACSRASRQLFYKRLFNLVVALSILVFSTACVPATQSSERHLEFFFSDEVWGGSPFSETQRKDLFVAALKTRGSERISRDVPFETDANSITVKRFSAIYEVDANIGLPKFRSGYVLELAVSDPLLEIVTLTNTLTGVSWSINLNQDE